MKGIRSVQKELLNSIDDLISRLNRIKEDLQRHESPGVCSSNGLDDHRIEEICEKIRGEFREHSVCFAPGDDEKVIDHIRSMLWEAFQYGKRAEAHMILSSLDKII
ncbi:hypothetical protein A3F08_03335 [Candidatus Berkelbacteria bacterium RIFCSPHIGHO2_12_FULL_36_9]|uniref:Uncharacterized protein n=1 Tax=Candidatus Berkelbacteria bacterium RIFCSPHIGHO2_12_FULL_36_9 TaxID=1797469 RepID=A0A1F5EGZ1_9BACT|nr:MAG: hypothetical protein A3F08_03335 [Candidatus Berkelbacteria bacterium RIFCSPHIGHO2_12_FULL_36_9]